jgi:hypothetical protein
MTPAQLADQLVAMYGPEILSRVIGDGQGASPAQNAVATALLIAADLRSLDSLPASSSLRVPGARSAAAPGGPDAPDPSLSPGVAPGTQAYAAAERFAALPAAERHAWLVRHLAALRAGQLTLAQLP